MGVSQVFVTHRMCKFKSVVRRLLTRKGACHSSAPAGFKQCSPFKWGMGWEVGEGGSSNSNDALRLVNYPATVSLILSFSLPFQINEIRRGGGGGAKSSRCRAGAASAASNFSSLSSTSYFGFSVRACVTTVFAYSSSCFDWRSGVLSHFKKIF